jgi:hypothetical protein
VKFTFIHLRTMQWFQNYFRALRRECASCLILSCFWVGYVVRFAISGLFFLLQQRTPRPVIMFTTTSRSENFQPLHTLTRHSYYKLNIEARSRNHFCRGKIRNINFIYGGCVSSLSYPARKAHAPYCIVICSLPAVAYFTTISLKWYDFLGKKSY